MSEGRAVRSICKQCKRDFFQVVTVYRTPFCSRNCAKDYAKLRELRRIEREFSGEVKAPRVDGRIGVPLPEGKLTDKAVFPWVRRVCLGFAQKRCPGVRLAR